MVSAPIAIETARNPFDGNRLRAFAREGDTIAEMILSQGIVPTPAHGVLVTINGEPVPEPMFCHVRPKAGTSVFVRVVPRGGDSGKAILSIVISVLVIAAAVMTGGAALAAGTSLLPAAAMMAGGLVGVATGIQSLVAGPPQVPFSGDIPQSQDSAALLGTKNTARLHRPMRTVLGKYRVYPDYLAKPFAERVGKDSILRLLFCFGYGPLKIEDVKIGETPIEEMPGVRYNLLPGWDDDADLSIFRDEVDTDTDFQPELPRVSPDVAVLTTQPGPEEISFDLMFPSGLMAFSDGDGSPVPVRVRFTVEEQELDTDGSVLVAWAPISSPTLGIGEDTGTVEVSAGTFDITLAERGTVTRGLRWAVPAGSTAGTVHQVRITRTSTIWLYGISSEDAVVSDARVVVLRTIKPHTPTPIKNLARIELEINANDTGLSGTIDKLSALCTSIVPKWDNLLESWGPTHANESADGVSMFASRNAAWLFAHMLRGPANSRPVPDSRIDALGLADWAGNLDGTGLQPISGTDGIPRNLDAVVDYTTTVRKLLADIAGAGRGALNLVDGKYSVVQDIPRDAIVQHFSPRNSSGFSGVRNFRKAPHAIKTHFVNPDIGYQRDERIVYDDGYSEAGGIAAEWDFGDSLVFPDNVGEDKDWWVGWPSSQLNGHALRMERTVTDTARDSCIFHIGTDSLTGTNFEGSDYTKVRIRLRALRISSDVARAWRGYFYFTNETLWTPTQYPFGAGSGNADTVYFDEPDWDGGDWVEIEMDLSDNVQWIGETITHIRFDLSEGNPTTDSDIFEIDWVRIDNGTVPATEFTELSLWGVADPEQVFRDARYHLASHKLRPEVFSISADVEHIVCQRGDLVRVSHDVIGVGYGGARLKSVTNSGGEFITATMDEEFSFDGSRSYAARIRQADGNDLLINVVNQGGTSSILEADGAADYGITVGPAEGDLILFGERETESLTCLIMRISPKNDLTASIELVEYNEAVYDPGTIPDYITHITIQNSPTLLRPINPQIVGSPISDESALAFTSSGTPEPQIVLNVMSPENTDTVYAPTTHYHAQFRMVDEGIAVTDWINAPRVDASGDTKVYLRPVEESMAYDIRVRSISDPAASASDWVLVTGHTVIGLSTPPPAPTDLSVWGDSIRWNYGEKPADFLGFIVKTQSGSDSTWATGIPVTENIITQNWIQIGSRIQPGQTTIMVRAVDIGGNESEMLSAVRVIRSPDDLDVIATQVNTSWYWPGTKTDCAVDGGTGYLQADIESTQLFYHSGSSAAFWSGDGSSDFWGTVLYTSMDYTIETRLTDNRNITTAWPGFAQLPGRQRISELDFSGSDMTIEYRPILTTGPDTYGEWSPWPGHRDSQELEFLQDGSGVIEDIEIKFHICGGTTRGILRSITLMIEGLPLRHTSTSLSISDSGTIVSLVDDGWRKITNMTVTPTATSASTQGAISSEVTGIATLSASAPYELTGPTVYLYDSDGDPLAGTASILIEGF